MTTVRIIDRFDIVPKQMGTYHSFPTLIRQENRLWLACRSGSVSGRQDHGVAGKVQLYAGHVANPQEWQMHGTLFEPSSGGTINELDAILSNPEPELVFLATRDYAWRQRNNVYLSKGSSPAMRERRLLTQISDQFVICFGHIRQTTGGELLMPGYNGFDDEPMGTPVLLSSVDRGDTWSFRCKVASSTRVGVRLTEYSLSHMGGTRWSVLIRNETAPCNLYRTESRDDGRTWSTPTPTELCGHAPMILDTSDNAAKLVIYRDLAEDEPGVAIGMNTDNSFTWKRVGRLNSYRGSIYDGGYGDLVQLDMDRYLAVYYLCDQDASPWIEGIVFSIN
jgi:hypothetical protein